MVLPMDDDRRDVISTLFDKFDDVKEFYDENEEEIHDLLGVDKEEQVIEEPKDTAETLVKDEEVVIDIELSEPGVDEIGIKEFDFDDCKEVSISYRGKRVDIEVPSNIDMDGISSDENNGVLTITIPRDTGINIESEKVEREENIDTDDDSDRQEEL